MPYTTFDNNSFRQGCTAFQGMLSQGAAPVFSFHWEGAFVPGDWVAKLACSLASFSVF